MASDKQIKLGVSVDQQSTNSTLSTVKVLIREFEKLATTLQTASKSMGSLLSGGAIAGAGQSPGSILATAPFKGGAGAGGGNIGGNGPAGLAGLLNQNTQAFRQMAQASDQFSTAMVTSLRRNVDQAKSSLTDLQQQIHGTSEAFNSLSPAAQMGPSGQVLQAKIGRDFQKAGGLIKQVSDGEKALGAMGPDDGGGGGPGLTGARQISPGFRSALRTGGIVAAGAVAIANEYMNTQYDFVTAEARLGRTWGQAALDTRRGHLGHVTALNQIMMDPNKRQEYQNIGQADIGTYIQRYGSAAWNSITSGNIGGVITDSIREGMNLQTSVKENQFKYLNQQQNTLQYLNTMAFIEKLQSEGPMRMDAMRSMGVGEQSLSRMALAAQRAYGFPSGPAAVGALAGAAGALSPLLGRTGARTNVMTMLRGVASGLDHGQAATIIGSDIVGAGSALGVVGGLRQKGMDIRVAGTIAGAAAHAAIQSGGYVGGDALAVAMSSGIGNGPDAMMHARARAEALGATSTIMGGGGDGFGQGTNVLSAMGALRRHGVTDIYSIGELTKVMQDPSLVASILQSKKVPQRLADMGINWEMVQEASRDSLTRQLHGRMLDSGANTAQAAFNRDFNKLGGMGNISGVVEKFGLKRTLRMGGNLLGGISPQLFRSPREAESAFANIMGIQMPPSVKRTRRLGDVAAGSAAFESTAAGMLEESAHLQNLDPQSQERRDMREAVNAQRRGTTLMGGAGMTGGGGMAGLDTAAEGVTQNFQDLGAATRALTEAIKTVVRTTGHEDLLNQELTKVRNARARQAAEQKAKESKLIGNISTGGRETVIKGMQ